MKNAAPGDIIEDDQCQGLVARKNANGYVSFQKTITVHGRARTYTLGRFPEDDLDGIRTKADAVTEKKFVSYT